MSLAKILAARAREKVSKALNRDCGSNTSGSLAWLDPDSWLLKTFQRSFLEGWTPYSAALPRSGMMRSGTVYQLRPLVPLTGGIGSSLSRGVYPTPTATEYGSNQGGGSGRTGEIRPSLQTMARNWPTPKAHDSRGTAAPSEMERNSPDLPATAINGHHGPVICEHGGKCRRVLSPRFVEALMGLQTDHTALEP